MIAVMQRALPLVAALGFAGCASGGSNGGPFAGRGEPARVEVINNNFNDATVWAVFRVERVRLGMVTGKTTSRFQLSPERLFEPDLGRRSAAPRPPQSEAVAEKLEVAGGGARWG